MLSIKDWSKDDRPREKLLLKGCAALSDTELIAILLSTGTQKENVLDVAKNMLAQSGNSIYKLSKLSVKELQKTNGIGQAKAISIIAALELGRRRSSEGASEKPNVRTSKDAYQFFQPMFSHQQHEEFWTMFLNSSGSILSTKRISSGGIGATVVDSRLVFKYAVDELASAVILCHNHPSGVLRPSDADIHLTQKLKEAAKLLDMTVSDHIIIAESGYYSFADDRLL